MSGIRVKNIYYMLAYAFEVLREREFRNLETETFKHSDDLFASILIVGISGQIKRGLTREYIDKSEPLSLLRGKIDLSESLKLTTFVHQRWICKYEVFSVNNMMNRIVKTALLFLLKSSDVATDRRRKLRQLLGYFDKVEPISKDGIKWSALHFHQNNAVYRMIIGICRLVLERRILTQDQGASCLMTFEDDRAMSRLYEKFVLKYYLRHFPQFHVSSDVIHWNLDTDADIFLPKMQSDIVLSCGKKKLIIDTKWYRQTTQYNSRFNSRTYHSANLYQIFTYVKNEDKNRTGNVSGLLLYAKTDEPIVPDSEYRIGGNRFAVKTLDLGADWASIDQQLHSIAQYVMNDLDKPTL